MKTLKKSILLLASLAVMSLASCVNDGLTEGPAAGAGKVAALDEQAASIEATVEDLNALQTAAEGNETALDEAVKALETHIADLRSGASLMEGTMATFAMQKKIAGVIGAIEASDEEGTLKKQISNLEKGISAWAGKNFDAYYPAAKAEAAAAARLAGLDLRKQKIHVEAILSDVEAGLRKNADKDELTELAAAVNGNMESAEELAANLSATAAEVEAEYAQAVETAVNDPEKFDLPALKQFNSAVASTLAEADNTLAGLIARVEACEAQLADIKARLESLESKVDDLEELLGMIQSVTFMSEYSAENAIAYYNLGTGYRTDGKKTRTPAASIDLNYIVRPAAAAKALTASDLWDKQMKVFGYYAGRIEQSAVTMFDFDITNVTADATTGIVTVSVSSSVLNEGFYFKETGAKLALSIATGKTDLTSKFVEVVPKDASSTVYVESLSLSGDYVEVECDLTARINATLAPNDVTEPTIIWTSSDDNIAVVSGDGVVSAKAVGEATITATTKGTDEWGQTLSKTCRVKVLPNIKLEAASYVELWGSTQINIKSTNYIDMNTVSWSSSNANIAAVDENGVVTGVSSTYNTDTKTYDMITITCQIGEYNPTYLSHQMPVVVPQPKGVKMTSLADGVDQKTIKIGEEFSIAGTIVPEAAAGYFRMFYQHSGAGNEAVATVNNQTGAITSKSPGSVTFLARVLNQEGFNYYYPAGNDYWRFVTVNVEPYWVETITFPAASLEMAPEETMTLTPTFTSDVDNVPPSYPVVRWKSSNTNVATVDAETGEITAVSAGAAVITATASHEYHEYSVPEGADPISASFNLTVEAAKLSFEVGDIYYSDGTISSTKIAGKTPIGIVFAKKNAWSEDTRMQADGLSCTNGLVVGLKNITDNMGPINFNTSGAAYNVSLWINNNCNGYQLTDLTKCQGYANTYYLNYYSRNVTGLSSDFTASMYWDKNADAVPDIVSEYGVSTPTDKGASKWYVPSFAEMELLYDALSDVNDGISTCGSGTQLSTSDVYWMSSVEAQVWSNKVYPDGHCRAYDLSAGDKVAANPTDNHNVRLIFAF